MDRRLERCRVHVGKRLLDAMWALEQGAAEIALVVDDEGRLVGTMTDGDARRALLHGATLESPLAPHMQRNFTCVGPEAGRAEVLELMQAQGFGQIPVVDRQQQLVGLHLMREIIGCLERDNWAVVMAGGKGQRLNPITEHLPKPMIPVAGRPILERLVLHLTGFGIRRIFLAINYLGHIVEEHFGDGSEFGCEIDYLREEEPLGTGGALSLLPKPPETPLLLLNGDLVTQANVGAMLDHHTHAGHRITVAVRQYSYTVPYGCIDVQGDRIVRLEEKPILSRLVNAGIYVLDPELVARVPSRTEYPITSLIGEAIDRGEPVGAFEVLDDWIDVGRHDQLRLAREGHG
jgi:dTDP-glucose pyrophosphorylase